MASRWSRLSMGIPLVLLTPLLAAPRCHLGDDDVPLGSNPEAGAGGEGAASGTGGSGANGGSSAGGSAQGGFAGTSAPSGGFAGTSSGGGRGDAPCLETLTPISGDVATELGFSEQDVQTLLAGSHRTALSTRKTAPTNATLEFVGPVRVFYVESERNPDFTLDIVVTCENHVRAKTYARFVTDDGVFDETFPELDVGVGAVAGSGLVAGGGHSLERGALRGSYDPPLPDTQCLNALQFDFTITENEFSGLLLETILNAPCGSNNPDSAVLGAELGNWRCVGAECRVAPSPSTVVEAGSCAPFGDQTTQSGDEASFARRGDVLSREESWGCGCATRPEHVMVYSPSSPLELRLCHDDSADGCEAACSRELSYDLSRAFAAAGTTEFRFADSVTFAETAP